MGQPMVMKRRRVRIGGFLSALVVLQMLAAWPAHAEGATAASCLINMSVHVTPGVSMVPTSGVETTGGETGSIACTGTFNGATVRELFLYRPDHGWAVALHGNHHGLQDRSRRPVRAHATGCPPDGNRFRRPHQWNLPSHPDDGRSHHHRWFIQFNDGRRGLGPNGHARNVGR